MSEVVALSMLIDLVKFCGAVVAAWGILHLLDRLADHKFTESLETMRGNPIALSIYLAVRFFAVATIAAAFVR